MSNIVRPEVLRKLSFEVIPSFPMVSAGDPLARLLLKAIEQHDIEMRDGDVVCIAQKIVSKAEGQQILLSDVVASEDAIRLAEETDKDPALCQLILDESETVMRKKPGVIIVRHRLGHVGANAGIDQSNIEHEGGESALLLPVDPDASARSLKAEMEALSGVRLGVLITDSMNRPWRMGTIGGAIGCAGLDVLDDARGGTDMYGRELKVTLINRADSLAATATLLMGETTEGTPVVLIRGLPVTSSVQTTDMMMRPLEDDLFK